MSLASLAALIRLGRPLFLGGGFLMYALGAAIAAMHGHAIDVRRYALGQLAVTAFQLMTHYANDYFDYDADCANTTPTRWSGGSRVLATGELPRRVALIAALVLAALGLGTSIVLAVDAPTWTFPTLLAMFVLAWEYSAPPLRLCASGAGELDTALVVTGLVPWLAFSLQAPDLAGLGTLVVAIVPLGCTSRSRSRPTRGCRSRLCSACPPRSSQSLRLRYRSHCGVSSGSRTIATATPSNA